MSDNFASWYRSDRDGSQKTTLSFEDQIIFNPPESSNATKGCVGNHSSSSCQLPILAGIVDGNTYPSHLWNENLLGVPILGPTAGKAMLGGVIESSDVIAGDFMALLETGRVKSPRGWSPRSALIGPMLSKGETVGVVLGSFSWVGSFSVGKRLVLGAHLI